MQWPHKIVVYLGSGTDGHMRRNIWIFGKAQRRRIALFNASYPWTTASSKNLCLLDVYYTKNKNLKGIDDFTNRIHIVVIRDG